MNPLAILVPVTASVEPARAEPPALLDHAAGEALVGDKPLTALYHTVLAGLNIFGIRNAKGGLDDAVEIISNTRWLKPRAVSGAADDAARRLETEAAQTLEQIQRASHPRAHFYDRHGAHTTIEQQWHRSVYGVAPDTPSIAKFPVDSARFLTHSDQLEAVNLALDHFKRTGQETFSLDLGKFIGEDFTRYGEEFVFTTNIRAVFKDGQLLTLFPLLKAL